MKIFQLLPQPAHDVKTTLLQRNFTVLTLGYLTVRQVDKSILELLSIFLKRRVLLLIKKRKIFTQQGVI